METAIRVISLLLLCIIICCSQSQLTNNDEVSSNGTKQEMDNLCVNEVRVPTCKIAHEGVKHDVDTFLHFYNTVCNYILEIYDTIAVKVVISDIEDCRISLEPYAITKSVDDVVAAYVNGDTIFMFSGNRVADVIEVNDENLVTLRNHHRDRYGCYADVTREALLNVRFIETPENDAD